MTIIKVDPLNLKDHLEDLIALGDEFLNELGEYPERDREEKVSILEQMVSPGVATVLLKVEDELGEAAGISYYNYGTGYSCGGAYLWLNCIYIRKSHQKRGYGSKLIRYIETEGHSRNVTLFICGRSPENEASRKLFDRMGFSQSEGIVMAKKY